MSHQHIESLVAQVDKKMASALWGVWTSNHQDPNRRCILAESSGWLAGCPGWLPCLGWLPWWGWLLGLVAWILSSCNTCSSYRFVNAIPLAHHFSRAWKKTRPCGSPSAAPMEPKPVWQCWPRDESTPVCRCRACSPHVMNPHSTQRPSNKLGFVLGPPAAPFHPFFGGGFPY